jgi:hypothetical protein
MLRSNRVERIRDAHLLGRLVDVIDQGIDAAREVVGRRHIDVRAG